MAEAEEDSDVGRSKHLLSMMRMIWSVVSEREINLVRCLMNIPHVIFERCSCCVNGGGG